MTPYSIQLDNNVLKVDFAKTPEGETIPADGDLIVQAVDTRLEQMISSGELKGGNLLKIYGRISVLAGYTLAHKVAHLYRAIAVSDTRLKAYVVVVTTASEYSLGSRIDFETGEIQPPQSSSDREPSFLIDWDNNILNTRINPAVRVDGDLIVQAAGLRLEQMLSADQLKGGKLLRIYGRSTVLASFAIASQVAHLYSAIAVFDPKLGDRGLDRYIVTISHSPQYQVGQTLELEYEPRSAVKVVLCGPANTGKTVLKEGLKLAILEHPDAPEDFYSISGCPDGDGSFYSETAQKYPELAKQLKQEYKAKFTPEFATSKARDIQRISNSLLLFDVGGKITTENQVIMSQATHAVILVKTEDEIHAWKHLCETELDKPLPIAAIVYSDYHGQVDVIESDSPVLQGKVHYLERGEDVSNRLMVKALADRLINLTREIPSQADGQIQSHKI